MLSGVVLSRSSQKRLSEKEAGNPEGYRRPVVVPVLKMRLLFKEKSRNGKATVQ